MRTIVFFTSVLLMLLAGNVISLTGIKLAGSYSTFSEYFKKAIPVKISNAGRKIASIKNSSSPEEEKALICKAADDEDQNEVSPKKYRSGDVYNSIPFYYSFLNFGHDSFETVSGIWRLTSPRYILQRNLRI